MYGDAVGFGPSGSARASRRSCGGGRRSAGGCTAFGIGSGQMTSRTGADGSRSAACSSGCQVVLAHWIDSTRSPRSPLTADAVGDAVGPPGEPGADPVPPGGTDDGAAHA